MEKVEINTDTIQLDQFLKWTGAVESGGQVKMMLEDELIFVNDVLETARRKRLKNGDVVKITDIGSWQVVTKGE
ncbi:MAG: RNA-binding S4 domain-containing protein [Anaerovibrio sp.]|uniref:RNA-binding S4 domain-containing protein n=1 Tax=Anaerovibrio sp. TaxID=1872532 RepID=UPI0025C17E2F|nr:RNA-binding S4 domain-containing protein [Anaerovibrio sp.]MBE6098876.1 RNA-binding S4 domain-containing protein [Anaerovibrio sp.]